MDSRLSKAFENAVNDRKLPGCGGIILDRSGEVLWKGTYGTTDIDDSAAPSFTENTTTPLFSCTKLLTSILALQLLEEGKLQLDDPVEKYLPRISKIQVLTGFDEHGKPTLQPATKKPTILHLLTHTSGFAYDFISPTQLKWRLTTDRAPAGYGSGLWADFETPFLFEPGEGYCYGVSIDWLGAVLETITGQGLHALMQEKILKPLKMSNTGATFADPKKKMMLHMRGEDGVLHPAAQLVNPENPEVSGGGQYLISTLADFPQVLLALLNGGEHPIIKTRILQEDTVRRYVFADQVSAFLPQSSIDEIGRMPTTSTAWAQSGEFLPNVGRKTWSTCLLLNEKALPTGRSAGSGAWAGMGNLYFFIDPSAGKCAFFVTCVLPFMDPEALYLFDEVERAMYGHESKKDKSEIGGNTGPLGMPAVES